MPLIRFANNAKSYLTGPLSAGASVIDLPTGDGAKFPTLAGGQYYYLTIYEHLPADENNVLNEIIKVTARVGDQLTVSRGQDGTTARAWVAADKIEMRITAAALKVTEFEPGARLVFAQAAAPAGWTQDTSDNANNRMLRVVAGAGNGVGGSHSPILNNVVPAHTHGFTTGGISANHTHSGNTGTVSADHTHGVYDPGHSHVLQAQGLQLAGAGGSFWAHTSAAGDHATTASGTGIWLGGISANHYHGFTTGFEGQSHTHSGTTDNGSSQTNWTPRYTDLILCQKD